MQVKISKLIDELVRKVLLASIKHDYKLMYEILSQCYTFDEEFDTCYEAMNYYFPERTYEYGVVLEKAIDVEIEQKRDRGRLPAEVVYQAWCRTLIDYKNWKGNVSDQISVVRKHIVLKGEEGSKEQWANSIVALKLIVEFLQ